MLTQASRWVNADDGEVDDGDVDDDDNATVAPWGGYPWRVLGRFGLL